MLVSFSVANFRSFRDEVTLNMVASNKLADHEDHLVPINATGKSLVRAAVLYGANAAGKSNLIRAMGYAQRLIRERSESMAPADPFRLQSDGPRQPSSFEFRILIKDRVFVYGFDVLLNHVTAEWLSLLDGGEEPLVFQRDETGSTNVNGTLASSFSDEDPLFSVLDKLKALPVRKDQLFLNRAASLPADALGETLGSIVGWFQNDLLVVTTDTVRSDILDRLYQDEDFRKFCAQFMSNVGTGVGNLKVDARERDANDFERRYFDDAVRRGRSLTDLFPFYRRSRDTDICPVPEKPGRVLERKLFAEHPTSSQSFHLPFGEESDGTQVLLNLLPVLWTTQPERNLVIVIDELDRSLHPLLCWEVIRFFSESCPSARKQLIVTTHEAHLLNQRLLRRDEYWFVEKDEQQQQTRLTSLSDYAIRKDLKIEKGYLQGRFGAIPIIGGMHELQRLLECSVGEEPNAPQEAPPQS